MTASPYLSVIIPAFNEAVNFKRGNLSQVYDYLSRQKYTFELLLVNDGSTDLTLSLLKGFAATHPQARVVDIPHGGKAAAVSAGIRESAGEVVLFSDMDQATPIDMFARFLPKFRQGYDVVIGSRQGRKGAPLFRQILAYGMMFVRTLILRLPLKDTQCGFKAFTRSSATRIFSIFNQVHPPRKISGPAVNPGFDVEILYLARKLDYKIAQVEVSWTHQESRRVRFLPDAIAGLRELLLIRFRAITNAYRLKS